jgi:hypothetical protein
VAVGHGTGRGANPQHQTFGKAHCTLQNADVETMTRLRKDEENPIEGEITAWCRAFSVAEWSKVPLNR